MERLKLAFGVHNHQPVGNFEHVFREGVEKCYLPFLEVMSKRSLRFSIHTSGPLIEWLDTGCPQYHELVREMVSTGRVEMIGGGYYEPILPIWPEELSTAQIRLMQSELKKRYGSDAKGLWVAERVWDPSLPHMLAGAGVEYTVLDDSHFRYAGLSKEPIVGYYLTERAGSQIAVLPISQQLRYMIPFKEPHEILDYLRSVAEKHPGTVVTYADDGEKFGMWPGTHDWVYTRGWLDRFLDAIEGAGDWLEMIPLGEALNNPPEGRIYLPCASYEEMMEWALPPDAIIQYEEVLSKITQQGLIEESRPFLRGGFWDNFLVKYPETNLIHKRILAAAAEITKRIGPPDNVAELPEAWRDIFRAQCNCAYWHGLFGGVYMNYLRHALWKHMLAGEASVMEKDTGVEVSVLDADFDGKDEIIVFDGTSRWGFKHTGATCFITENLENAFAFHNTMSRRPEAYHFLKQKPGGVTDHGADHGPESIHEIDAPLEERPVYDRAPRFSFIDHFFPSETTLENFRDSAWEELGDFSEREWQSERKGDADEAVITFRSDGTVSGVAVKGEKEFMFRKGSRTVDARIRFVPDGTWPEGRYGIAFNFTLLAADAPDRYYLFDGARPEDSRMASEGIEKGIKRFSATDDYQGVGLEWELGKPCEIWRAPIMTISRSERGFEKTYQGSWVMIHFPLPASSDAIELKVKWRINKV